METVFEQTLDLAKRNYGLPDYLADYLGVVYGKPLEIYIELYSYFPLRHLQVPYKNSINKILKR